MTPGRSREQRAVPVATIVAVLIWVGVGAALQWSVVRFSVPILLTLTMAALALAAHVTVGRPLRLGRRTVSVVLLAGVVVLWTVPLFTYLTGGWRMSAYAVLTVTGLGGAVLLWRPSIGRVRTAYILALLAHLALVVIAVRGDPAPRIDVWVTLQQASDALARGESFYSLTWVGSPGIQDAFTYFPWMAVLLAPGRWLAGDIRWALAAWSLALYAALWALARRSGSEPRWWSQTPVAAASGALVLVTFPGHLTQIDQAWTEPVLAALLLWWAVLVRSGRAWWAVIPLALALASKQHMVLLIPLLMLCRPFGWRRTLTSGALSGLLMSPWLVGDFTGLWHDTVTLLVSFHPIRFANTWYLFALNVLGVQLPLWITGLVVVGALAAGCHLVFHRQLGPVDTLTVAALVLLVANLVNKQAFYNQFWLSAALVIGSLVASKDTPLTRPKEAAPVPACGPADPGP